MPHPLPALTNAIERRRAGAFLLGLFVVVVGVGFDVMESEYVRSLTSPHPSALGAERWLLRFFAVATSCLAALAFYELFEQGPPEHWPLVRMLRERADEIVWVYAREPPPPAARGVNVHIVACTDAGASVEGTIAARFTLRVLRDAAEAVPHATVGSYEPELEKRWKRDPASLRTRALDVPPQTTATYRGDGDPPPAIATRAPVPTKPRHVGVAGYVVIAVLTSAFVLAMPSVIDALCWRPPVRDTPILYGPQ